MGEKFLEIGGHRIRYLESGSGEDLLLVHGLGASAERWDGVAPLFSERFRVVVPDLIGFGRSDKPAADYTPAFFSDFVSKFVAGARLERPNIVGSSLGGQISAEYASANPQGVGRLVLVSPAGIMKKSTPALDAYVMAALYPNEINARNAFEMMDGSGRGIDDSIVEGFVERMRLPNAKLAFVSAILGLKNSESVVSKLRAIRAPTLVVWGADDPVIPVNYADAFVSSIPGSEFLKMDGCGHTPYVQEPDAFASAVLGFLEGPA